MVSGSSDPTGTISSTSATQILPLVAALFAPAYYVFGNQVAWAMDKSVLLSVAVMSLLLIWRHAENISRLVQGKESKLGHKQS